MGIDVDSKLMVGCSYQELEDFLEKKVDEHEDDEYSYDSSDVIEEYFDYASPYYDCSPEYWFIGFEVKNYQEVGVDLYESIREASDRFFALTGIKGRLRGGSHVS